MRVPCCVSREGRCRPFSRNTQHETRITACDELSPAVTLSLAMKKTATMVAIGRHEQPPDDEHAPLCIHSPMRLANLAAGGKAVREFVT